MYFSAFYPENVLIIICYFPHTVRWHKFIFCNKYIDKEICLNNFGSPRKGMSLAKTENPLVFG